MKDLKVPPSGIFLLEERIALQGGPDIVTLTDEVQAPTSMTAVLYYTANMHLYKVLNDICANLKEAESTFNHPACSSYVTFYAELPLGTEGYTLKTQKVLSTNLEKWRRSLPNVMKWSDSDPPSTDIHTARLRAGYYEARCIAHRPSLLYTLRIAQEESEYRALGSEIKQACKICVRSAILSAEAFDRFNGRLMVPNIFRIAHGYFFFPFQRTPRFLPTNLQE